MHKKGYGVVKNTETASIFFNKATSNIEWFITEAETGDSLAQYNLAYCYIHGHGVSQDYKKAVEYYQLAADQNMAMAQVSLGDYYWYGEWVLEDYKQAMSYYKLAANQGLPRAYEILVECYSRVEKHHEAAYYYLRFMQCQKKDISIYGFPSKLQNLAFFNYAKARIACDNKDYAEAICLCRNSLKQQSSENSKPVWILLAVASMCLAATGTTVQLTSDEINAIKEYKKEILGEIKKLPSTNIYDKNELQNQILLAAFENQGVAGAIFHAPRDTWVPNFLGGGECKTDSGTLKDIAEELVPRGLLRKAVENQDSAIATQNQALDKADEVSNSTDSEESVDESEIELMNLPQTSKSLRARN